MQLTVNDILDRRGLVTISQDATVDVLNRLLAEYRLSGVPVVDDERRLVGVVSRCDIARLISPDLAGRLGFYTFPYECERRDELARDVCETRIRDMMETRIHSVTPPHPLTIVAKILCSMRIHRLVVLENNSPVGVLTSFDLLQVLENPALLREAAAL